MTIMEGKANTKIRKAAHMDAPY
jgi:hypothetical protein